MLGAVAGHAAAGMSRKDLKELGEHLDAGRGGRSSFRRILVRVRSPGGKSAPCVGLTPRTPRWNGK